MATKIETEIYRGLLTAIKTEELEQEQQSQKIYGLATKHAENIIQLMSPTTQLLDPEEETVEA